MNFSKPIGFLSTGTDLQNSIKDAARATDYFGAVSLTQSSLDESPSSNI